MNAGETRAGRKFHFLGCWFPHWEFRCVRRPNRRCRPNVNLVHIGGSEPNKVSGCEQGRSDGDSSELGGITSPIGRSSWTPRWNLAHTHRHRFLSSAARSNFLPVQDQSQELVGAADLYITEVRDGAKGAWPSGNPMTVFSWRIQRDAAFFCDCCLTIPYFAFRSERREGTPVPPFQVPPHTASRVEGTCLYGGNGQTETSSGFRTRQLLQFAKKHHGSQTFPEM